MNTLNNLKNLLASGLISLTLVAAVACSSSVEPAENLVAATEASTQQVSNGTSITVIPTSTESTDSATEVSSTESANSSTEQIKAAFDGGPDNTPISDAIPEVSKPAPEAAQLTPAEIVTAQEDHLANLYEDTVQSVVFIVTTSIQGVGSGSGFVWDEDGHIPHELWPKAAAVGILGLGYPEEFGGVSEGIDLWYSIILNEEMARVAVGGVGATLMVHGIGLPPVINFGSDEVKQMVAPPVLAGTKRISLAITEPGAGSDVAHITTTARLDGDHYVVNGSKTYITGGMNANWFTTAVRTGGEGASGVSALLIPADTEGVSRTALDKKQGWWCSDTATIYFDNARVPAGNLIGQENKGFSVIMNNFNAERLAMSAAMEGFSRVCLEDAVALSR